MEMRYFCSKLGQIVELNLERLDHIYERHSELQDFAIELELTIKNPDIILQKITGELLLIHWFENVINGKFITAVVINDQVKERKWVVTAFTTRSCPKGELYE